MKHSVCIEPEGLVSKHSAWLYLFGRPHTSFDRKCHNSQGLWVNMHNNNSKVTINEVLKAFRIHWGRLHWFFLLHTSKIVTAQNAQDMKNVPPETWNCAVAPCRSWPSFLPQRGFYHTVSAPAWCIRSVEADAVQPNLWPNSPPPKRTASSQWNRGDIIQWETTRTQKVNSINS